MRESEIERERDNDREWGEMREGDKVEIKCDSGEKES